MIAIIIPAYNVGKYIAQCLCSLREQTYTDWQAIVVDDGSMDNTASIVQAFVEADKRFTLLQHSTNKGQSAARNIALRQATGDYICFVDADDWLDKNYLQTLISNMGDKDILQSGYRRVTGNGIILEEKIPRHFYQFTSPCARLYRASFLLQVNHFPEGMIYEDVIFSLNLWANNPTYRILHYVGYNYRFNESSTTSQSHLSQRKKLYDSIHHTKAPWWLKWFTTLRLKIHFLYE